MTTPVNCLGSLRASGLLLVFCVLAWQLTAQVVLPAKPIPAKGMENVFRVSDRLYSGSAPEGDEGFAQLQKLGIKTVISVDGSKPDAELAHKYGLHYVHLPHGYNGISPEVQAELVKAAQVSPGPIFVHCHHGKHRGPAAVAVICMANEGWSTAQGDAWLKLAGTATNYQGLYLTVEQFRPPSAATLAALPSTFPEVAQVAGLVDAMVAIDEQWDHLKAIRKAEYGVPPAHPDVQPANEAVILGEHFREAQRLPEAAKRGADFVDRLKAAEAAAKEVETLLRQYAGKPTPEVRTQLDRSLDAANQSCATCHKRYRDPELRQ